MFYCLYSVSERGSHLDSYLLDSSCTTTGTGVNRYSNQSDKLLPNGNGYTPLPTTMENGVNDLSVMDCSVIDSEYVTEYCQNKMQVSNEKRRYSSGSEDDENDNISRESTSKNRLSFLSTDSDLKIQSDFVSETDGVNFIDETEKKEDKFVQNKDSIGEFAREFIYNLIDSVKKEFPDTKDKNEVPDTKDKTMFDCVEDTQEKTGNDADKVTADKIKSSPNIVEVVIKESAPNVLSVVNDSYHSEPMIDMFCQPLLRRSLDRNEEEMNQT